ncbi:hypothetical protein LX36DRAFT_132874 [Colletotrichum falcatum]|nr:hypothetical protein LX36DRAFT_132874 [Colletotrichum falcatum]
MTTIGFTATATALRTPTMQLGHAQHTDSARKSPHLSVPDICLASMLLAQSGRFVHVLSLVQHTPTRPGTNATMPTLAHPPFSLTHSVGAKHLRPISRTQSPRSCGSFNALCQDYSPPYQSCVLNLRANWPLSLAYLLIAALGPQSGLQHIRTATFLSRQGGRGVTNRLHIINDALISAAACWGFVSYHLLDARPSTNRKACQPWPLACVRKPPSVDADPRSHYSGTRNLGLHFLQCHPGKANPAMC